jgi:hypothetical protein
MKADFQAPNESVRVLARVQEALFVAGAFPDGFYEGAVNIPVSVAPLIRVFRSLVFRQVFPWRQVFQ